MYIELNFYGDVKIHTTYSGISVIGELCLNPTVLHQLLATANYEFISSAVKPTSL